MTPDDVPAPARRAQGTRGRFPATGGRAPGVGLRRPDGSLQVGVGPGSFVLAGAPDDPVADRLGSALAAAPTGDLPPRCPVVGHGRLAVRLSAALGPPDPASPSGAPLVVLVHQHVVPAETAVAAARDARLVLPVVVQERRVVVGPVSGPPGSPCLHCLDLHRRDRDPAWPDVATWLGHPAHQLDPVPVPDEVLAAAEGLVLLIAGSVLAGRPASAGLAHEVGPRAPHVVTRRWERHPRCPWHPGSAPTGVA